MNIKCGIINESTKYIWGTFSTSRKIPGPEDKELYKNKTISVTVGKRDRAALQLALKSDEDIMGSISSTPSFSCRGNLANIRIDIRVNGISNKNIKMFFVGLAEDDDRIHKADLLLNDESMLIEKNKSQIVWIETEIPADLKPGNYIGKITIYHHNMFDNERIIESLEFFVDVKNVLMPEPRNYSFYLDLWQHLSNIARKHEVRLWSNEHFLVIENYIKSLADLGQKAITVIASEIPWSGQGCFRVKNYPSDMFEYSIVRLEKDLDGSFLYDFTYLERYIDLCMKYGIDKEIEVMGLICIWAFEDEGYGKVTIDYEDAIRVRYFDRNDSCYKYIKYKDEIRSYFKALETFFIEKGVIDIVRVAADEPYDKELYNHVLAFIKEAAPSFKYKTAINHADFIEESKGKIKDYVAYLPAISGSWPHFDTIKKEIEGKLLWYVCCDPQYPNTFIASPLLESRFIGWLTAFLNIDGFLRWNYTVWPEKPRERIGYNFPVWYAGDTNFVYPANNGVPLLTLRYKNLRRGIEDFELIQMIRNRHPEPEEFLGKVWDKIFKIKDFSMYYDKNSVAEKLYSLTHEEYEEARRGILCELERLGAL